jgi:hypothetical protein
MTEPPVISDFKSRQTIFLIWAIVATVLALVSTGLAVFFFLQPRVGRHEPAGWSRWETSDGGNGHCYKAVAPTGGLTWTEADRLARVQGGYLATVTSAAENDFVFSLVQAPEFFANGSGPALGGFQQDRAPEPNGGWCWVSGDPWNYSNWHPAEPNNGRFGNGTEDRLQFYSSLPGTPSAQWNDINRNDPQVGGYVIERND